VQTRAGPRALSHTRQIRQGQGCELSACGAKPPSVAPIHAWDDSDSATSAATDTRDGGPPTAVRLTDSYDGLG